VGAAPCGRLQDGQSSRDGDVWRDGEICAERALIMPVGQSTFNTNVPSPPYFASPFKDCPELEPGVWIFAGRDRPGIRGVHLCHREGGPKSRGEGSKVHIFHYVP
jgi:hypothetical protein